MGRAAFVLGNSKYQNEKAFPEIRHCKKDAKAIFELITTGPTGLFDPKLSKELIDISIERATDELEQFFDPLTKEDFVLMFFAGHGRSLSPKHLALAMQNTKDGYLTRTALDVNLIGNYLTEKKIKRYALFFDCCRSGAVLDATGFQPRGDVRKEVNLDYLSGTGRWLVASCQSHENAYEEKTLGHGIFTHFVIQGIKEGRAVPDSEEFIDIHSLCAYTSTSVDEFYSDLGQEPIFSGGMLKGNPLFIAKNPKFQPNRTRVEFTEQLLTRIYTEDDLSDEAAFLEAKLRRFRQFTDKLTEDTPFWEELVYLHGQALGLSETDVISEVGAIKSRIKSAEPLPVVKSYQNEPGVKQLQPSASGVVVIMSASQYQSAYSHAEFGSVFAIAMKRGLSGEAADRNGVITVGRLFKFIEQYMRVEGGDRQTPRLVTQHERGSLQDYPVVGTHIDVAARRRRALIVATDTYSNNLPSLPHNQSCAQAIARVLETSDFHVSVLLGEAATARSVYASLAGIMDAADSHDTVLIYFSGHGALTTDGEFGLFLHDSELSNPSTVVLARDLRARLKLRPRDGCTLLFLDASYSGPSANSTFI